jgi:Asp-tRNA(Asn)/Glu-tRNA(Gln) amidotransferase A subunit family amidase
VTGGRVADAIGATLGDLHALDARTHAVEWFEDDRVRADAARLDARDGPCGPLHGVPVTVKDWIDVEGFPCAGGSPLHRARRPADDASVVARLRGAGAVVVAKTKPWDGWDPDGEVVVHPADPARVPGGSSSGDAVATAAGAVPLGVGSDSGGSVRLPAAWCGVYGLRPTTGRLPTTGHFRASATAPTAAPRSASWPPTSGCSNERSPRAPDPTASTSPRRRSCRRPRSRTTRTCASRCSRRTRAGRSRTPCVTRASARSTPSSTPG